MNPKVDFGEFADVEDMEALLQPRIDRAGQLASEWERHLLSECLRLGIWRLWFIQWWEYKGNSAFMNTRVFPPWAVADAQKLARSLGEQVVGLSLKKGLLISEEQFLHESGASPNWDVMAEMRRVLGKRCQRKCK